MSINRYIMMWREINRNFLILNNFKKAEDKLIGLKLLTVKKRCDIL